MDSQIFFLSHFYQEKYTCKFFPFSVSLTANLNYHAWSYPKPENSFLILASPSICIFIQPPKSPWCCSAFDSALLFFLSFQEYLLNTYFVAATVLRTKNTAMSNNNNKTPNAYLHNDYVFMKGYRIKSTMYYMSFVI